MKDFNPKITYIVNPAYDLKEDINRVIITNSNAIEFNLYQTNDSVQTGMSWLIHPIYAYFFSFFDGKYNLQDTVKNISITLDMDETELFNMIKPYIENSDTVNFHYKNFYFVIPKNFLIPNQNNKNRNFDRKLFLKMSNFDDLDLQSWRLNKPNEFLFVVTNKCVTDCNYCYANKDHIVKNRLPFDRLKEIIEEAKMLKMRAIDISGGELFLYKDWYDLLKTLINNGFYPYISTKVPINKQTIDKIKDLGIKDIQISLDVLENDKIQKILNVNQTYLDKMKKTIALLYEAKITVKVKSVISNVNCNYNDYVSLINYLIQYENISNIAIAPGEPSLYKTNDFCTSYNEFVDLKKQLQEFKFTLPKDRQIISIQDVSTKPSANKELREKEFENRSLCSGNTTNFVLLPDGKVTICEQLYWHPKFIIGDLNKQSIMDMWTSSKAKDLFHLSQRKIPQESPCRACKSFKNCREKLGVCWKMVVFGYGHKNIYYPDPRCPQASPVFNEKMFL